MKYALHCACCALQICLTLTAALSGVGVFALLLAGSPVAAIAALVVAGIACATAALAAELRKETEPRARITRIQ